MRLKIKILVQQQKYIELHRQAVFTTIEKGEKPIGERQVVSKMYNYVYRNVKINHIIYYV